MAHATGMAVHGSGLLTERVSCLYKTTCLIQIHGIRSATQAADNDPGSITGSYYLFIYNGKLARLCFLQSSHYPFGSLLNRHLFPVASVAGTGCLSAQSSCHSHIQAAASYAMLPAVIFVKIFVWCHKSVKFRNFEWFWIYEPLLIKRSLLKHKGADFLGNSQPFDTNISPKSVKK
jgi:hypothetical protein